MQDFLTIYSIAGLIFSGWFSWIKLTKSDQMARNASIGFRIITMPAAILLWPLLLFKIVRSHE